MKEFERWLNKREHGLPYTIPAEMGWRAALEWVLENFDGKTDMLTLGLKIKEELEDETIK